MNAVYNIKNEHFLAVLNLFLAITALLGNTLILVALRRESSLSPQSKLLYRNLAITDFFVGIIVEPAYVVYLVSVVNKRHGICHYARVTCLIAAFVLCLVSLCTLTTISVERLLRLLLVRRYRQIVTYKGTCIAVIVIWVLCVVGALTQFWNPFVTFLWCFIVLILCGVTTICSYSKIFFHSTSQSSWCSDGTLSRTPDSSNSTQRSSLQKGSVQCTVGAGNIVSLLSTSGYTTAYNPIKRDVFSGLRC